MKSYTIEWWGIDNGGYKYHEYMLSPSKKERRVRDLIESQYGYDTSQWKDFGMRRIFN